MCAVLLYLSMFVCVLTIYLIIFRKRACDILYKEIEKEKVKQKNHVYPKKSIWRMDIWNFRVALLQQNDTIILSTKKKN